MSSITLLPKITLHIVPSVSPVTMITRDSPRCRVEERESKQNFVEFSFGIGLAYNNLTSDIYMFRLSLVRKGYPGLLGLDHGLKNGTRGIGEPGL